MKLTIGVMFGGESVEHEISIISAIQAMEAIDKERYDVIPIYISKEKHLYSGEQLKNLNAYKDLEKVKKTATLITLTRISNKVVVKPLKKGVFFKSKNIDLMIPIVHGSNTEDGTIAGYLQTLGVPFVGSDVIASGVGQDKIFFKHVLENSGLPIVPWFWFYGKNYELNKENILIKAKDLGFPVVVKPATLGSSIGIVIAHNAQEFEDAILSAMMYDKKILVEKKVDDLLEINCSTLHQKGEYKASVCEEVMKTDEILSDRKSTRLNSSHLRSSGISRMPSSA